MLFVSNLGPNVSEDDLRLLFEEIGPVKFAKRHYDLDAEQTGGWAVIVFENSPDFQAAVDEFTGIPLDGVPMTIEIIDSKSDTTIVPQNRLAQTTAAVQTEQFPIVSTRDFSTQTIGIQSNFHPSHNAGDNKKLAAGITADDVLQNFHDHFGNWEGFYNFLGSVLGKTQSTNLAVQSMTTNSKQSKEVQTRQTNHLPKQCYPPPPVPLFVSRQFREPIIGVLQIDCIPTFVSKNGLFVMFKKFGRILDLSEIIFSHQHELHLCGVAFVQFSNDFDANRAIQEMHMHRFTYGTIPPLIVRWAPSTLASATRMKY